MVLSKRKLILFMHLINNTMFIKPYVISTGNKRRHIFHISSTALEICLRVFHNLLCVCRLWHVYRGLKVR